MFDWLNSLTFGLTALLMLIGLFGQLIPIFPGIVVIWVTALAYGVVTFSTGSTLGWVIFGVITVLMLIGTTIDNILMGAGAKQGGASWASLVIMLAAGTLGTLLLPPFGGLIAMPAAVLLYEYYKQRDWQKAWKAVRGLATGWGVAFFIRFGLSVIMVILWLVWHFVV